MLDDNIDSGVTQGDATIAASNAYSNDGVDSGKIIITQENASKEIESSCMVKWAVELSTSVNLILLCYFIWYLWIIFGCDSVSYMKSHDLFNGFLMGLFICIVLNAAAYPKNEEIKDYVINSKFKIIRFFVIPFCVSTASIGCSESPECDFLFPTEAVSTFLLIFVMVGVFIFGRILHRIVGNTDDNGRNYAK